MHLTTHVHFGCGIIKLSLKQEDILRKISEPVSLRKLKLSEKFSREVSHARKSALGVRLIKLSAILAVLASQLCFGHLRMKDETATMITSIADNENFHYGCTKDIMNAESKHKMSQTTWYDETSSVLNERKLTVINLMHNKVIDAVNVSMMDFAAQHAEEKQLSKSIIHPINPCEVIELNGRSKRFQFENLEAQSCILWKRDFSKTPKL